MLNLQSEFIDFLIHHHALQFGEFTLKSGRKSPYFFNLGVFHTGAALARLGEFYAQTLVNSCMHYDVLFGPAYKGIPIVAATAMILAEKFGKNAPYCFNRKEKKEYGDVSHFVGAPLHGNLVMLDDVITAGTTVRDTMALLKNTGAQLSGIVIALDRQERGSGQLSAVQEVVKNHAVPVQSIVTLSDVVLYLSEHKDLKSHVETIERYRREYGDVLTPQ